MRTRMIIPLATIAIAAMVSCGKEDTERHCDNAEIDFAMQFTRGSSITDAAGVAAAGGFSVWAYKHTGDWATASDRTIIIDNNSSGYGHVTSNDGGATWNYGTPQFWPGGKQVSFFAYAPHGSATPSGVDAQGVPGITYEVPATVSDQNDLLIAAAAIDRTGPNPVNEVFYHALSRIRFSALKSSAIPDNVVVTKVELQGLYYKGLTTLQTPVSWTPDNSATANYTLSVSDGSLLNSPLDETDAQDITAPEGSLFLMPQTLLRYGENPVEMIVTFTVGSQEITLRGTVPASPSEWLSGKSYNYRLLIDGDMVVITCGSLESTAPGTDWGDF